MSVCLSHMIFILCVCHTGWKKYNDPLLLPIRARHYERVCECLTTALGRWLQKWAKLKGAERVAWESDPWYNHFVIDTLKR